MDITPTILLEPEKGLHITEFLDGIREFKIKNNIDAPVIARFNELSFEIPAEVKEFNELYQLWSNVFFNIKNKK